MRFISHYPRANYWSSSKLSHKIREHFGLPNPFALSWEDWDKHHEECKNKAPFVHWLTDKGFNKLQNIVMFPVDVYWTFKTANIWKYFRNLWLFRKCLWDYRSWDNSGIMRFMEVCAQDMSRYHKEHGHLMRSEDTAKELLIFSELLKRIREDSYTDNKQEYVREGKGIFSGKFVQKPNTLPNIEAKSFYELQGKQRVNDLKYAAHIFSRKLSSWWD